MLRSKSHLSYGYLNDRTALTAIGLFAWLWVLARACTQSLTIDEANTFLAYVNQPGPTHWAANSNNHVLNSALMRLSTSLFGASETTLRLPALLGAAVYLCAVYWIVRLISNRLILQCALFVCLAYNPFVMDYLVAARGYSIALAFLALAWALACRYETLDAEAKAASRDRTAAIISVSLAISFCANFAFAVVDGATGLLLAYWIGRVSRRSVLRTVGAMTWPGAALAALVVGPVILNWKMSELWWGARSMGATLASVLSASLYEPSPYLFHPLFLHWVILIGHRVYPALCAFFLLYLAAVLHGRNAPGKVGWPWQLALSALCAATLIAALAIHQILYAAVGILLPVGRTALWIAPLSFLMVGAAAAVPAPSRFGRVSGAGLTAALALVAFYSIGCLRLDRFKEWPWDADDRRIYSILAHYNHVYDVKHVCAEWKYVAALNAYICWFVFSEFVSQCHPTMRFYSSNSYKLSC